VAEVSQTRIELWGRKEAVAIELCGSQVWSSEYPDHYGVILDSVIGILGLFASKEELRICEIASLSH
jgi:hypothetical protein